MHNDKIFYTKQVCSPLAGSRPPACMRCVLSSFLSYDVHDVEVFAVVDAYVSESELPQLRYEDVCRADLCSLNDVCLVVDGEFFPRLVFRFAYEALVLFVGERLGEPLLLHLLLVVVYGYGGLHDDGVG